MTDRDLYSEGWAEGLREARFQVLRSSGTIDAVNRIERLLAVDHKARRARIAENKKRRGTARKRDEEGA